MSAVLPTFRPYPDENVRGLIADFPSAEADYIRTEICENELRVYWTTGLSAAETFQPVKAILPTSAAIEVWGWANAEYATTDSEDIFRATALEEAIRVQYTIEPGSIATEGIIATWRIRNNRMQPPHQMGIIIAKSELEIPKLLIAETATPEVRAMPALLDELLERAN